MPVILVLRRLKQKEWNGKSAWATYRDLDTLEGSVWLMSVTLVRALWPQRLSFEYCHHIMPWSHPSVSLPSRQLGPLWCFVLFLMHGPHFCPTVMVTVYSKPTNGLPTFSGQSDKLGLLEQLYDLEEWEKAYVQVLVRVICPRKTLDHGCPTSQVLHTPSCPPPQGQDGGRSRRTESHPRFGKESV